MGESILMSNCCIMVWAYGSKLSGGNSGGNSLHEDLLLPYPLSQRHGPSHSHRFVRECQSVIHGNVTYETLMTSRKMGLPVAESKIFVSSISTDSQNPRWVSGHMTFVNDPLRTVSVLEPGIQNAQFGIKKDGTLVFGYLSEEDVLDKVNPFVQLISGVVWLLRNGNPYIEESMAVECEETQETGAFHRFVNAVSARTAVGHDREGRLVLFHIDGQTDSRGMNLWEVATFLKDQGVVNAINLDGGGSSTYVVNGSLASYPSDHCDPPMWRCPRNVSTVLCVHEPLCHPENCSGHGACVAGTCVCQEGWRGPACDTLTCQPPACGPRGLCTPYGCVCDAGWTGSNCSEECMPGFYGDGCKQACACWNGGSCDPVHGHCVCPAGFHGALCEQECTIGFYGLNCEQECQCQDMCPCDPVTGSCNITYKEELNRTMHRAGHCLATQMFTTWRQEDAAHQPKPYFAEATWMIVSSILCVLLLASTICNMIQSRRNSWAPPKSRGYSYIPLSEMNGRLSYNNSDVLQEDDDS
ncbi:hypothetical protein AAFF_G00119620 [Aldrovandia affinis]|uniref:EGF-like domain-containing protein n=1 Tax=Aldrovandia affinis TaxID=143900 RepID=A0AAD7RS83_9TELE|nr:hypothetical protein AAFF_G00119620 [Aldrovandia affinis]